MRNEVEIYVQINKEDLVTYTYRYKVEFFANPVTGTTINFDVVVNGDIVMNINKTISATLNNSNNLLKGATTQDTINNFLTNLNTYNQNPNITYSLSSSNNPYGVKDIYIDVTSEIEIFTLNILSNTTSSINLYSPIFLSQTYPEFIYERLDMFDDENINVNFKLKDTADLAKIFSTFSQTFTIPSKGKNQAILNYYFNTEILRNSTRYLNSKIYVNKELFKVGLISINEGKYLRLNDSSITINFFTSLTNLKELYGDEILSETLQNQEYNIVWTDATAYNYTKQIGASGLDPDVIVPLVTNKRVWTYNDSTVNDIKYTGSKTGKKYIEKDELRPAIPFSKIMDGIATAKGITFLSPLFTEDEYNKLYVWCSGLPNKNINYDVLMTGSFTGSNSSPWTITPVSSNIINILYNGNYTTTNTSTIFFEVFPKKAIETDFDIEINVKWINNSTNAILKESVMGIYPNQGGIYSTLLNLNALNLGINNITPFQIRVEITANQFIYWDDGIFNFRALGADLEINTSVSNREINLYNMLPEIKTIDFLTSFIKMFNISIIEDPKIEGVITLLPRNTFFEETFDYTDYLDIETFTVKPTNLYKQINFKHNTSKYKSNIDFKTALNNREYGELKYISTDKFLKDEYKIETKFNIVPNRLILDTSVQTFYGFTSDSSPSTDYGVLYEPNYEDLTIFYYNGQQNLKDDDGVNISFNFNTGTTVNQLQTYNKVSIVYNDSPTGYTNSLGYNIEVDVLDNSFQFEKNLFTNYYKTEIDKIYNPNSRLYTYNLVLPPYEINRFSLTNIIIIGDKKYTIEEAELNIVDGKTKLTLMNIATVLPSEVTILTPPSSFTATLL